MLRIRHCRELWCRLEATVPIPPLAWEPPYAMGEALKKDKKKKNERADVKCLDQSRSSIYVVGDSMSAWLKSTRPYHFRACQLQHTCISCLRTV